jgi:hypothetical protein
MRKHLFTYKLTYTHDGWDVGWAMRLLLNLWGFNVIKNVETASTGSNFSIGRLYGYEISLQIFI